MLPELDGFEVTRRLREIGSTPVIMITARSEEAHRVTGLELGADDYVTKPFSPLEVVARVRAVLRRAAGEATAPRAIAVDDIVIEPEARRVTRAGVEVDLTRLEFDLLAELAAHPRVVFTRERLLEKVWGYQSAVGAKTVDVHVANLRRKLGDDIGIVAVRGVGYKIEPGR
jgi:DNA-binding response OmpR family regulator